MAYIPPKYSGHRVFSFVWPGGGYARVNGTLWIVIDAAWAPNVTAMQTKMACHIATLKPTRGRTTSAFTARAGSSANEIIAARKPSQYDADGIREWTRKTQAAGSSVGIANDDRRPMMIQ
jgi:hypothetical protein